jgi:hypothetical protein
MNKLSNYKSAGENFSTKANHKFNPCECLAKCAQWKLNVTMTQNKSSSGLVRFLLFQDFKRERHFF